MISSSIILSDVDLYDQGKKYDMIFLMEEEIMTRCANMILLHAVVHLPCWHVLTTCLAQLSSVQNKCITGEGKQV